MRWPHEIVIRRAGTEGGVQDPDTGAWTSEDAPVVVYDDMGFLWHKSRSHRHGDDRDRGSPSVGEMYLKDRTKVWSLKEGDIIRAHDVKQDIDVEARVVSIDHLTAAVQVADIRLVP